jgi:hypothetical protein
LQAFHAEVVKPHYDFQDIMDSAWVKHLEAVRKNPYEEYGLEGGEDQSGDEYEKVKASWEMAIDQGDEAAIDKSEVLLLLYLFGVLGAERQSVQIRAINLYPFARSIVRLSHQLLRYFPHLYPGLTR